MNSPSLKTFFSSIIPILSGVFSGIFVTEITTDKGLQFGLFYETVSFYILVILSICVFLYNRAMYIHEKNIEKFRDKEFCLAYVRKECLPDVVKSYQSATRDGDVKLTNKLMVDLDKAFK